jgi:hypothetical protein
VRRRRPNGPLALLLAALCLGSPAEAQQVDPERYALVKAAYVLNLLRLTQWPAGAFETEERPFIVQVAGEDAMTPYLEAIIRGERIDDRPVVVHRLALPVRGPAVAAPDPVQPFADALRSAHLVFVAQDALPHLESILAAVEGYPVLTVSDIPAFAAREGGMIGLEVRGGTVGLEANVQRLDESGVNVSARVLQLARIVEQPSEAP